MQLREYLLMRAFILIIYLKYKMLISLPKSYKMQKNSNVVAFISLKITVIENKILYFRNKIM